MVTEVLLFSTLCLLSCFCTTFQVYTIIYGYQIGSIWRANNFGQLGDSVKALADFNKALELEPENPEIFIARGQFYLEIKSYKKAIADANQTLNLNPKSAEAYSLRSEIYKQLGDINKANADAKKADDLYAAGESKDEEL